jgi:hypothetical protein
MLFGSKPNFALEFTLTRPPFGTVRLWIQNHPIGNNTITTAAIAVLDQLLSHLQKPTLEEFHTDPALLFNTMNDAVFSPSPTHPQSQAYAQYFLAPGYAPFDDWWALCLPLGPQTRFLFRRHDEPNLHDISLPTPIVTRPLETAKTWIESTTQKKWSELI